MAREVVFILLRKRKPAGPVDYLIVGLGNPGRRYLATRHNAGFCALEALAAQMNIRVNRVRFRSLCGEGEIGGRRVLLMMPQTYMNNSGEAVREAMQFYKLPPERVIVLFDDITLEPGTLRLRRKGSDGGQKGMASILYHTRSDQIPRIRIGVGGKPHPDYELSDWVLSVFTSAEAPLMIETFKKAAKAAAVIVEEGMEAAMNRFSG